MPSNTAPLDRITPDELDPLVKPFWGTRELHRVGLGHQHAVLRAIHKGQIPFVQIGTKYLIPTSWIRSALGLPEIVVDHVPAGS